MTTTSYRLPTWADEIYGDTDGTFSGTRSFGPLRFDQGFDIEGNARNVDREVECTSYWSGPVTELADDMRQLAADALAMASFLDGLHHTTTERNN